MDDIFEFLRDRGVEQEALDQLASDKVCDHGWELVGFHF